jgi:hypothetical protein
LSPRIALAAAERHDDLLAVGLLVLGVRLVLSVVL